MSSTKKEFRLLVISRASSMSTKFIKLNLKLAINCLEQFQKLILNFVNAFELQMIIFILTKKHALINGINMKIVQQS